MKKQEQEQAEEDVKKAPVTLATKIGIVALPMIPTVIIDLITHGGLTPPALTAFGLSYLAFERTPKVAAWLGEHKEFLAYLNAHPDMLVKLDRLTKGYFSQQLEAQKLPVARPHDVVVEQAEQQAVTQAKTAQLEDMEDLAPNPLKGTPILDFAADDELTAPTIMPDGPLYFSQILKTFTPSLEKIYLATLPDGKHLFIPARNLCHTALAGTTRGGKDHIIRVLMSQLCYAGAKVYLLDPNYTRYDLESVDPFRRPYPEDWTPFDAYLKNDPREMIPMDRKYRVIEHYLQMAFDLVERRLEKRGAGVSLGAPQFLFVNELPAIVDEVPKTASYLKKLLREGAKVGVFLVCASQDFHVNTLFKEIGGGVRKCFRTAFDVGSDPRTQSALGLLPGQVPGKGKGSLRCDDVQSPARLAYVDNEALYYLLGPSTYVPSTRRLDEEDGLMDYMVSGDGYEDEERHTETLPTQTRRHVPTSAYDARKRQLAARRMPTRVQGTVAAEKRQSEGVTQTYARVPDMIIPEQKPEPTINDALAVWNEVVGSGGKLSRYSLQERLMKKGFECGENKARDLLNRLRAKAEVNQSVNR